MAYSHCWANPLPPPPLTSTVLQMVCSIHFCRGVSVLLSYNVLIVILSHHVINACDCHKALRLFKLSYTQLCNNNETDLSIHLWKRESHPSGNFFQLEFQLPHQVSVSRMQSDEWRGAIYGVMFLSLPYLPMKCAAKSSQSSAAAAAGWAD